MQAYLCIRCSKIWKFEKNFVYSPAVTTDLGAFGCQSSMKWKDQRYEMDGDSPVIGWGDPEEWKLIVYGRAHKIGILLM